MRYNMGPSSQLKHILVCRNSGKCSFSYWLVFKWKLQALWSCELFCKDNFKIISVVKKKKKKTHNRGKSSLWVEYKSLLPLVCTMLTCQRQLVQPLSSQLQLTSHCIYYIFKNPDAVAPPCGRPYKGGLCRRSPVTPVSNMATRWGICAAGKISHDFTVGLKSLPPGDHQVNAGPWPANHRSKHRFKSRDDIRGLGGSWVEGHSACVQCFPKFQMVRNKEIIN